ncbi:AmmeMemoRadiSam system protein B, variant [Batrachochytrium dendrobatidis JEL423]|nr:AmmeMemoRadiSam system protein B, variant [Batrachochytrium dendrobatidis JEL423]
MHLPYLYKIMSKKTTPYTIVPILVGASRSSDQHNYATIFAPYLADSTNLFIVSSDFCHWGPNFGYTYQFDPSLQIHASIEKLDREAMRVIETGNSKDFEAYLKRTKNTICGRNPIGVLLHALECLENMGKKVDIKFTHYAQSSRALTKRDNSVSYASAHVTLA